MAILFWLRLDQICPKWIKLDQIGLLTNLKNVTIKSCHNYHENKHGQLFWIRSDQICPKCIEFRFLSIKIIGTGFVVCAVLGVPSRLIIVSQLP